MTEAEFQAWADHPITKALKAVLRKRVEDLKGQWATGNFTDQSQFATAIMNAKAIGIVNALEYIVNMDYEQFEGEVNE